MAIMHRWYAQERGGPHWPRIESRGHRLIAEYELSGPILFAGGPWNGRIAIVEKWIDRFLAPHFPTPLDSGFCEVKYSAYDLRRSFTPFGAVFYMYACVDDPWQPVEDPPRFAMWHLEGQLISLHSLGMLHRGPVWDLVIQEIKAETGATHEH